jgi:deoxyadenosine/deoxycytidine kinase
MNHKGSLPAIVVVSGAIGVGKSTLLDVLKEAGFDTLPEPVDLWRERGWLQEFYEDQRGKAFWFQQAVYASSIENVERKLAALSAASLLGKDMITVMKGNGDVVCMSLEEFMSSTNKTRRVLFVERYIYDQLCFWQTNVMMGNGSKAEDDVYMSFWQRWRHFIPEPTGYILLRGDTHVEERGRREEITASKDEGFAQYQAKLDEMHCKFFAEPLARPEEVAKRIRGEFWEEESSSSPNTPPLAECLGIPCLHLKVSDFPYHKDEGDAKSRVIAHIESWLTKRSI